MAERKEAEVLLPAYRLGSTRAADTLINDSKREPTLKRLRFTKCSHGTIISCSSSTYGLHSSSNSCAYSPGVSVCPPPDPPLLPPLTPFLARCEYCELSAAMSCFVRFGFG